MRAKQTLHRGLGILRRHALVTLAVFVVVVAAGAVYMQRQIPTFRATAQLLVEKRTPTGRELPEAVSFMQDATYAATQRYLLKHDENLAAEVLRRLGEEPTPARRLAVLAGITVEPEPATLVVKLSYEGPDAEEAIRIVNTYAQAYVAQNRDDRLEILGAQLQETQADYQAAAEAEGNAATALDAFRREHSDIAFTTGENPHQGLAQQLGVQATTDDLHLIDLSREEAEVEAVLQSHGIGIERQEGEGGEIAIALTFDGSRSQLEALLRSQPDILGLPAVSRSANVSDFRAKARSLEDDYGRLKLDFREPSDPILEIRRRIDENQEALGTEVRLALERSLRDVAHLRARLKEVRSRLEAATARARATNECLAEYRRLTDVQARAAESASALREQQTSRQKLYDESRQDRLESITVFKEASSAPLVRPNRALLSFLTAVAAIFLSIGTAALLGYLDDTIKTKDDFDRLFRERLPFIGYVPRISTKDHARPDLVTCDHPQAAASEAFRSVRTSILLSRSGRELQNLVITSASPGEGKTTVAINLAVTMARGEGRVLLVDADLRRSRIHTALDLPKSPGLTNALAGRASLTEAVRTVRIEGGSPEDGGAPVEFDVLTSGELPPNPSELLGSPEMRALLEEVRGRYSKVILDTPPLVAVTDACVLGSLVDGVFIVISVGKTSWRLIRSGLEDLEKVDAPLRGAILNSLTAAGEGYGYYDSYRYRRYDYSRKDKTREPAGTAS